MLVDAFPLPHIFPDYEVPLPDCGRRSVSGCSAPSTSSYPRTSPLTVPVSSSSPLRTSLPSVPVNSPYRSHLSALESRTLHSPCQSPLIPSYVPVYFFYQSSL